MTKEKNNFVAQGSEVGYAETNNVYRYVPVNQFAPLTDDNWLVIGSIQDGYVDAQNPWQFWLHVTAVNRSTKKSAGAFKVGVQIVSYERNIYRIRFDPSVGTGNYKEKLFGPVVHAGLTEIRSTEINGGAPATGLFAFKNKELSFKTKDLLVSIDQYFKSSTTYNNTVIHRDADSEIENLGLGATFVDPAVGSAVATVKKNNKDSPTIKERFYGQGEVNVSSSGKSVSDGPLWMSTRAEMKNLKISFNPWTAANQSTPSGKGDASFSINSNMWWLPSMSDAAVHHCHYKNFIEVHTQILGVGRMQKFDDRQARVTDCSKAGVYPLGTTNPSPSSAYYGVPGINTKDSAFGQGMYEEYRLAPGDTNVPFPYVDDDMNFIYPWHQYYSDTDCLWVVWELIPTT